MTCDLLVVGAGPGGNAAALEAARLGARVVLAEAGDLGGTCLNRGCIPTKIFLAAAAPLAALAHQSRARVASGDIRLDVPALQKKKARTLGATRKAMAATLDQAGVEVVRARARLTGPDSAVLETQEGGRELGFRKAILAPGSRPTHIPAATIDQEAILDSDGLLDVETPPESLIVVGGGFIGLELGQFLARLGTAVTVVEALDRILPCDDPEAAAELGKALKRQGFTIRTKERMASLENSGGRALLRLEHGETLEADKALVAVGRRPATEDLGLDAAGVTPEGPGFVITDDHLRATDDIYCVGDANGRAMLAHAAEHQGRHAARHALGRESATHRPLGTPFILYGDPEVLRVGLCAHQIGEAFAAERGPFRVSRAPLAANPMAQAHAATQGFVKVLWDDDRVAGVTAVGSHVSSLAGLCAAMVENRYTLADFEKLTMPHPSLDEALAAAVRAEPAPV
jgi:dihydrolipoamide dehydrogenase